MSTWRLGDKVLVDLDLGKGGGWTRRTTVAGTIAGVDDERVLVRMRNPKGVEHVVPIPHNEPRARIRKPK